MAGSRCSTSAISLADCVESCAPFPGGTHTPRIFPPYRGDREEANASMRQGTFPTLCRMLRPRIGCRFPLLRPDRHTVAWPFGRQHAETAPSKQSEENFATNNAGCACSIKINRAEGVPRVRRSAKDRSAPNRDRAKTTVCHDRRADVRQRLECRHARARIQGVTRRGPLSLAHTQTATAGAVAAIKLSPL